jgi:hypothetical protein
MPQQTLDDDAQTRVIKVHLFQPDEERRRGRVLDVLEEGFGEGNQGEVGELGCRN